LTPPRSGPNWGVRILVESISMETPMRSNCAKGISAALVSVLMIGTSFAGDAVKSGLSVGEPVNPFLVDDITGPNKGKTLCYR